MIYAGLDLSKTHFGLVVRDSQRSDVQVLLGGNTKGWVHPNVYAVDYTTVHIEKYEKGSDKDSYTGYCMEVICTSIHQFLTKCFVQAEQPFPAFLAIEDYAYGASAFSVIPIAEVTGAVKRILYNMGICMRHHDPQSVKMWGAGNGAADKQMMVDAAHRDGFTIPNIVNRKQDNPGEDLADAYWLLKMVEAECRMRLNPSYIHNLFPPQVHVVNRVTLRNPVGLLNRPFVGKTQPRFQVPVRKQK